MAAYKIYHKNGSILADANGKEIEVHSIEYNGTWMGECFVTATFENEAPIDFSIGDYIVYRNERFEINYDPGKIKCSSKDSYGGAFKYESVKFNALSDELVRCDMLDLVLYDNNLHYTALPQFVFYVESLDDLLDRIQANLDELYGKAAWKLYSRNKERSIQRGCTAEGWEIAYGTGTTDNVIDSTSISISDQNCWDALSLVNSQFDVNFIIRDRNVYVGTAGVPTANIFKYGKDKGLYEIEQNSESDQFIVTRLRAYGSNKNLPSSYYATLNGVPYTIAGGISETNGEDGAQLAIGIDKTKYEGSFTDVNYEAPEGIKECRVVCSIGETSFHAEVWMKQAAAGMSSNTLVITGEDVIQSVKPLIVSGQTRITFTSGANAHGFNGDRLDYSSSLPNNMACDRLMLPGFPNKSLQEWWAEQSDAKKAWLNPGGKSHLFSIETYRPYVESLNKDNIGIRPSSVFFDKEDKMNGIVEIYPTIEGMEIDGIRIDEIDTGTSVEDDGIFADTEEASIPNAVIYLKSAINFDVNELKRSDFAISMKDGMCAGRSFNIAACRKEKDGRWRLQIERRPDDSLGLYFPYRDFQIKKGDHFVLTGIELPDAYVEAASEKLLKYCIAYIDKNDYTRYVYQPKVDEIFMARQHDAAMADSTGLTRSLYMSLKEGDIMLFKDDDLGIDAEITIDQLTIKEEDGKIPTYEITLREEKEVGTIQKIQNQISSIADGNGINVTNVSSTANQIKDLTLAEARTRFLSKMSDDYASGLITFLQGLVSEGTITAKEGLTAGTYMDGLYGSGASIDKIGNAVFESIYARSFISAPEFRYNKITVTEGEQWNTNGYGIIESVDTDNRIIVLHLEENDYASVVEGDYCRGIYNNIGTTDEYQNLINIDADDCGFPMKAGFFTSYFRVSDIIESSKGKCSFRYELRNSKTPHPCAQMKFAQYANDIDETRQASAYFSSVGHFYFQAVEKVSSWVVRPENVTIRFGWVDGFPAKLKDGSTQLLRNYGLYVPDNIYFGNAIVQIDAKSVENIKTELKQYSIEISNAVDVIIVDDAGNVIDGLYKLNPDNTKYDYRISPAVYVKKGNDYLVPAEDGDDSDNGTYKMYITPKNCTAELINGTICVTSIDNIKDGISGTSDDTEFDYDAMRKTESISVVISAICEGIGSISKEFHVAIKHDSKPYISFVMDNQNASVSWNTKAQKYIGLPYTVNLNARRADESVAISGITVHSGDDITTTSIINEDGSASVTFSSLPQTLGNVTDVPITIQAIYAGISYEQTIVHTINRYEDVNVYELKPNVSQVVASVNTNGDKVASVNKVTCEVLCNSSDDKQYYLTKSDMENAKLTVKYSVDGGTTFADYTSDGVTVSPEWENIIFRLYLNGGLIDSQDVPVMLNGVDGEGIEYVFILSKEEVTPNITFNPDSEEYQKPDYLPTSTSANTEPQGQWTDDSNGVGVNYPFEYCAIRRKQYGKWLPFATPKIWGRYAKDGENPYVIDLTNNSSSVLCNDKGEAISSYEDTTLIIFEGIKDVTSTFSISFQAVGITCEKSSTGYTYSFSNITADVANVTFTAVKGNVTLKTIYTVTRIKNGVMYSLVCSHDTVHLDNTGTPVSTDSTLYISVRKTTPEGSVTSTSVSEWQGWGVNVYYLNASGTYEAFKTSYDISYATAFGSRTYAVFQIRKSDGSTILDSERINAVSDGVSITGIEVEYQVSNSQTEAPTSWATTSPPTTAATPYLWTKTTISYSKGNDTVKKACVGKMGDRGIDGNGTEWIYYLSNSSTFTGTGNVNPKNWAASQTDDYIMPGQGWTDDPSGVTETNQYEWISQRTKNNGTWGKFSQPTIWAKWGEKGDNAVEYSLKPNMTSIIIDDNNKLISGSSLSVTLYKTAGSSTAQSTNYKIFAYSVNNKDEKTVLGQSSGNPSPFAVDIPSTIKDDLAAYYFEVHDSKNTLAVLTVPVVRHGKPSISIVDRGLFDLNSGYGKDNGGYSYKYVNGTLVRDMVKYLSNNAYYYYMVKNRTDLRGRNVTASPNDSSEWEQASKYNLLVADVAYAYNATLGGFHVDKDAFWTGADSKDNATILLDGKNKKVRVTGEVNATSGVFQNVKITNNCWIEPQTQDGDGWFMRGGTDRIAAWWLGYSGKLTGQFTMNTAYDDGSNHPPTASLSFKTPNIQQGGKPDGSTLISAYSNINTPLANFSHTKGMMVRICPSEGVGINFINNAGLATPVAFNGAGHGCLNGVIQGYKLNVMSSGLIDISKGNTVYCNGNGTNLILPTRENCNNVLGTTGAFALDLTIIGASGARDFRVYGKRHNSTTGYTTDCYLLNNDHGDNWYATMSQGDVLQLKLIYTGSAFYAYIVSLMQ